MANTASQERKLASSLVGGWDAARVMARKELAAYFGSPMALIFVGAFLVVTLFSFFWVGQWSEEERAGTLEILCTLPVRRVSLVLGKFLAVLGLVAVALALTLFLPITVDLLGGLDWGPVVGGYLAALLVAAAYAAIGLWVSSRTDNQIVALIVSILICGVLYLVGTQSLTSPWAPAVALRASSAG